MIIQEYHLKTVTGFLHFMKSKRHQIPRHQITETKYYDM